MNFDSFEKGQTFYIHNGAWGGVIVQDDKDGKFYATIGDGVGYKRLEGKNIDDMFSEGDYISKDSMTLRSYYDLMVKKGIGVRLNKGDMVASEGEIYIVDEDFEVISFDTDFKDNSTVKLINEEQSIEKPYKSISNKDSFYFARVLRKYLLDDSKRFYTQSIMSVNKDIKDRVEKVELEDEVESDNFDEYILDYISKNSKEEYSFRHEGVYIRGDFEISGSQFKYMYVIDEGVVKLFRVYTGYYTDTKAVTTCLYEDIRNGVRLNLENRGNVSLFECLENLARTDYFFNEDKKYKKDDKFFQSRY